MKTIQFSLTWLYSGLILISPVIAQDTLHSKWHSPQEISFPSSFQYDEKNELHYLVSNDTENIYIHVVTVTDASQIRALRHGLTIFVDPEGKGRKGSYIKFLPPRLTGREAVQNRPDTSNPRVGRLDQRKLMASRVSEVELKGFGYKKPVKTDITELTGISARIDIDDQVKLSYVISIPIEKVFINKSMESFSLGVESGYMDMQEMSAGRQGMQNRPQGMQPGGSDRPGAARSPEEMEQRRQEIQKLSVPLKMWVKTVTLAKNE